MATKFFTLTSLSAAFISLGFSSVVLAVDEKIETVYISATRSETSQLPVATQITVIDSEQIRLSGATNVGEVLRSQAGIQIQDTDGSGGRNVSVAMHGFTSSSNTLILVDGRKLNNPTLAGPALNTVAIKDIERIEIIQGSAGVLFGDQAVGGVINIITHRAIAGETHGSVSIERGSFDADNYAARINQGFESGLSYKISAQKRNADNYRNNNQTANTNVLGKIGYDFEKGSLFVEHQQIRDDLRAPGALLSKDFLVNPRQTKKPNDYSTQNTDLDRVGGEIKFPDEWKLLGEFADRDESGNAFYDDYKNDPNSSKYSPYLSAYEMHVKNIAPRLVGSIGVAAGDAIVTVGYDGMDADYKTKNGYTNITQQQDAMYSQIVYPLTQQFTLSAGARFAKVDDTDHVGKKSHNENANANELGVNYKIDSTWRVFARYADGFRFANADENGYTLPSIAFLDVQTSRSQEAGVVWEDSAAEVKYSLYHMAVDNEIIYDPMAGAYGANINLPSSERQGFMFEGRLELSDFVSVHGNYTYTDAQLTSGSFNDKSVPFVANNVANIGVNFNLIQHFTLVIDANYTGSRYLVGDNANAQHKVDAVTLFNVNMLWDYQNLELGLRIKNLSGEKYADSQGISYTGEYRYPQPQRAYAAHIGYRF